MPKVLPSYVPKSDIEKLQESIKSKKTHRGNVERDLLIVDLAIHTGLRRSELANLRVGDIDVERQVLVVRQGKGAKDRVIPLSEQMTEKLGEYIQGKGNDNSLFGLAAATISGKIKFFAKRAGLDIHAHSLRDYFATSLSEKGATIREIQSLLGHTNLTHTERYTLHTDEHLRKAIELIDGVDANQKEVIVPEQKQDDTDKWLVTIKGLYKDKDGNVSSSNRVYFSHFVISNEGKTPAIDLGVGLLNSKNNLLKGQRDPVLMIGEKMIWEIVFKRPDGQYYTEGQYYVVCQYKKSSTDLKKEQWNQTWLPFQLTVADKPDHYYVAPGKIVFKNNILLKERISVF